MHRLELKALAAVNCHQPHRIHVQGGRGHLAQIAFFGEQHKLPDAVERALNRHAEPDRAVLAQEIQELPDRDVAHPRRNGGGARHGAADIGAIEQIGRKEIPWLALRRRAPCRSAASRRNAMPRLRGKAGQFRELVETLQRALSARRAGARAPV